MLEISGQVVSRFEDEAEQRYIAKLAAFLREKVPSLANEDPAAMTVQCKLLKDKAGSFNMRSEQAVAAFAMTAAVLGLDFVERFRGARQILYADTPEDEKAELLEGFTVTLVQRLKG
jgi:hypothetical protein